MSTGNSSSYAEPKIGRMLELARRERGLSLHQVEQATKIRARYLWELEHENFDVLPAVYVQGSLKTYANFLGLDGEALVQELRRRQASHTATQDPAYAEHPKSDYLERAPILLGGAAGAESREMTEDKGVGAASVPAGNSRLYLVSGAFLVLILVAVALALTLAEDRQPAVSQVREPLISQAPPEASPVGSEKVERAPQPQRKGNKQDTDDKDNGPQPQQSAGSPDEKANDEGAGQTAQTGQEQDDSLPAQDPGDATATPSASPTAETAPATAEPDDTSTSPTPEPDTASTPPPATEAPAQRRETTPPPAGGPRNTSPGPRDSGDFDVEVGVGSDDLVRITGDPVDDD
jgi:cytoskeletal protein RodZ